MRISPVLAAMLPWALATPAAAFDCARATTPVEKTICGDPALKARDDRLEAAYAEVRRLSSHSERTMLARAQKTWIGKREQDCPMAEAGPSACIADMTDTRIALLEGRPDSGPGMAGRIIPVFIVQDGDATRYELNITLLRSVAPDTPGERLFNEIGSEMASRAKLGPHGEETDGRIYAVEETMTLSYASPTFVSVMHSFWTDTGGAHGHGGLANTNIDMVAGRQLEFGDVFDAAAARNFMSRCKDQLIAQKRERLAGEAYDPGTDSFLQDDVIGEHVTTLSRWSFREGEAQVSFDAYAIGSYAEGPYHCIFPMSDVKRLARPEAPLP